MGKLKHLTWLFIFLMGMSLFCLFYKVTAESNEISKDNIDVVCPVDDSTIKLNKIKATVKKEFPLEKIPESEEIEAEILSEEEPLKEHNESHDIANTKSEDSSTSNTDFYYGDWKTVIVNKSREVPSNWNVNVTLVDGCYVDERIAPYLIELLNAARNAGVVDTSICSGYRSISTQQNIVNNSISSFVRQGYSYEKALDLTYKEIAMPGHSEHNLGLAVDFYSSKTGLTDAFENTQFGIWLKENAHKYGFILRYPKNKVSVTEINYEPWYYRYVGDEYALKIKNSGLCMEEYFGVN